MQQERKIGGRYQLLLPRTPGLGYCRFRHWGFGGFPVKAIVLLFVFLLGVSSAQTPSYEECIANGTKFEATQSEIQTLKGDRAAATSKLRGESIQRRLSELELAA